MSLNYIVSAKKATVVTHAVVGNFTGDNDLNLILAKINRIQIYKVTSEGLKSVKEVQIFGPITNINLFKAKEESRDSLFILTAKFHASVIGWDSATDLPVTRAAGSVADRVGRVSDHGTLVAIQNGVIAMRIYDLMLKVIRWEDGKELECFNVWFDDPMVIDMTFCASLSTDDEMRMSYISQDNHGRHLKTIDLVIGDKEMKNISKQDNIENEARMILPVPAPYGGVIVVGQDTIVYNRSDNTYVSISPSLMSQNQSTFYCATPIDKNGQRFLLGDSVGRLFMLLLGVVVGIDGCHQVKGLKLELLGETSIAECLVYVDSAVVFVGSQLGDSQLIKLDTDLGDNPFVSVLETCDNLVFPGQSVLVVETDIGFDVSSPVDFPGLKLIRHPKVMEERTTLRNLIEDQLEHICRILLEMLRLHQLGLANRADFLGGSEILPAVVSIVNRVDRLFFVPPLRREQARPVHVESWLKAIRYVHDEFFESTSVERVTELHVIYVWLLNDMTGRFLI